MSLPQRRSLSVMVIVLVVLGLVAWGYTQVPVTQWIATLREWIVSLGVPGIAMFIVLYVLATVVLGPVSGLNVVAGLAYGAMGFPLVVMCATCGAAVAFSLGRYGAHARVNRWIGSKPRLAALQHAVGDEGWRVVALMRLSPIIPFGLQNYLFSVTNVGFLPFVLATLVGIMPTTALYVYVGTLGQDIGNAGMLQWMLVLVGVGTTALVAWVVGRRAAQVLSAESRGDTF